MELMLKAGEEASADSEFITVARMILRFGYSGFLSGHKPSEFFKSYAKPEDNEDVADEVSVVLAAAGSKRAASFGIEFEVPQGTNTSTLVTWDIKKIIMIDNRDNSEYQILIAALNEGQFPIGEWFWGSYKSVETGEYKNDAGETKKRFLPVPVEKFANEMDAKATVIGGKEAASTDTKWSDTARANYPDTNDIEKLSEEILKWLDKAKEGIAFNDDAENFPLPTPSTPPSLKKYIADLYTIDASDIDLLIPF